MRQPAPSPGISCENDLGNLLLVGNHEAKAIVLGGMQPGNSYGASELHRDLFLAPQGDDPVHVGSPTTQLDYCTQSLEPAGVVRRAPTTTLQYRLTPLGGKEGKAFAGHVLSMSLEAGELGLKALYGLSRTSRGKASRPPMDRLRILRMLLDDDGLHTADIQRELGLNATTTMNNLNRMDDDGVIEYTGIDGGDIGDHIIYGLPDSPSPVSKGSKEGSMPGMIQETINALIEEGRSACSLTDLRRMLAQRYPDGGLDLPDRQKYAMAVMNDLVKAGYVTKGPMEGAQKSVITLRDTARPVVARAVAIADGMMSGEKEFLREGRDLLEGIIEDERQVRTLVAKAFRDSPTANRIPLEERLSAVRSVLVDGPVSSSEAAARLKDEHGMTASSAKQTLKLMRDTGQAVSEPMPGRRELVWELAASRRAA